MAAIRQRPATEGAQALRERWWPPSVTSSQASTCGGTLPHPYDILGFIQAAPSDQALRQLT